MLRAVALLLCLGPAVAGAVETVRISMGTQDGVAEISARTLGFGPDSEDTLFTSLRSGRGMVTSAHGRLLLDGVPLPQPSVRFRAGEWARDAGTPGHEGIRVGELEVRGDVVVKLAGDKLLLINVLSLEEYLAAVLGGEMPVSFPDAALRAQAVAARTYALRKKLESYGADFHLGSSVLHQVYGGLNREDPRTRAAVEATRGEVLTYELEPIEAYFHASCGGHTESGLSALGRDLPYLQSVECPCGRLPSSRWELTLSARELKSALGTGATSLEVVSRSETGRARRVRVGPDRTMDAVSLRERLGYTRLKSLAFEVDRRSGRELHISGRGYGHGAGLCQWGAKVLADQGLDYHQILTHYYPGAELQKLY